MLRDYAVLRSIDDPTLESIRNEPVDHLVPCFSIDDPTLESIRNVCSACCVHRCSIDDPTLESIRNGAKNKSDRITHILCKNKITYHS